MCGIKLRHMWSDQRLISNDSEGGDHSPEESSELTRVLRCVGATETLAGQVRGKEVVGRRGEAAACATQRRRRGSLVPAGCRRLGLATSSQSRKNLGGVYLEKLSELFRNQSDCSHIGQIIQILPELGMLSNAIWDFWGEIPKDFGISQNCHDYLKLARLWVIWK